MAEFHTLRVVLGLAQLVICAVLWRKSVGYLFKFGVLMFGSAALNLAPAHPMDNGWKYFIQIPAYAIAGVMTLDATLEIFAFMRRRTFIEERIALLTFAGIVGLIPVWVFWSWPGENWYQFVMLARQYYLMWLAAGYLAAWCWLRSARPIHMAMQVADHGEFWGCWLITSAALASTTKYGALWRFAKWAHGEGTWRVVSDAILLAQLCICCAFLFNLLNWKDDAARDVSPYLPDPAPSRLRHQLNP